MAESNCMTCEQTLPNIKLYRCQTCTEKQDEASNLEFLCEGCLFPHIRKEHLVLDSKGDEPLICSKHNMICLEFCKDCDTPFCCKCFGNHVNHEVQCLDTKLSDIKKKMFELLTDLEMKEKPLRSKQKALSETVCKNDADAKLVCDFIRSECKKLEEGLVMDVEKHAKVKVEHEKTVFKSCEEICNMQACIRNALSQSNPKLIQNYPSAYNKIKMYELDYNNTMLVEEQAISFPLQEMLSLKFEELRKSVKNVMRTVQKNETDDIVVAMNGFVYRVCSTDSGEIEVSSFMASEQSKRVKGQKNSVHFKTHRTFKTSQNGTLTNIFPIEDNLVVLFSDETAKLFCSDSSLVSPVRYPDCKHFLWPYSNDELETIIDWCFWNPQKNRVCFSHEEDLGFNCTEMPKVRMSSSCWYILCFIEETEKRVVHVNIDEDSIIEIGQEVHNLPSIDSISCPSFNEIMFWSVFSKSLSMLRREQGETVFYLLRQVSWHNELDLFKCSCSLPVEGKGKVEYSFLPAIKELNGENKLTEQKYVFAVWDQCVPSLQKPIDETTQPPNTKP